MNKASRLALTAFIVGFFMLISPSSAYSSNGIVQDVVKCANEGGQEREFAIGWDNTNQFFEGKGDIPRLYCEGGFAGAWTIFVSSSLAEDDPRRYYNGIIPTPEPTPIASVEPEPTIEPTLEPEPTPIPSLEPEQTPTPTIEPTPSPSATPSPSVSPMPTMSATIEPTPEPPTEPTQVAPPPIVPETPPSPTLTPTTEPTSEPTPTPTPTPSDEPSPTSTPTAPTQSEPTPTPSNTQQVSIELSPTVAAIPGALQLVAAAEAIMNIGADMTDEEREEAQAVAVAAIIVTQLAQVRKIK